MAKKTDKNSVRLTFDYLSFGQKLNNLIFTAQQLRDEIEIAMIRKGIKKRERRANGERRGGLH